MRHNTRQYGCTLHKFQALFNHGLTMPKIHLLQKTKVAKSVDLSASALFPFTETSVLRFITSCTVGIPRLILARERMQRNHSRVSTSCCPVRTHLDNISHLLVVVKMVVLMSVDRRERKPCRVGIVTDVFVIVRYIVSGSARIMRSSDITRECPYPLASLHPRH